MTFQAIVHKSSPELVKRKIFQADARMFVREFTQNAIEAASAAGPAARVKWWEFTEGPIRKLSVWNNGRGMDAAELKSVMDLGVSGAGKRHGAEANFGIGAKLTGLKGNSAGVIWRSCKNGAVHELHLGWHHGEPGIIGDVSDVSHLYENVMLATFDDALFRRLGKQDCSLLSFEWTLAIFLGRDEEKHDTVFDPDGKWDGGRAYWLPNAINKRYYDLDKYNVTAINNTTKPQSRNCLGLYHIDVEREEHVERPWGLLRYCLLPDGKHSSAEKAAGYSGGHGALVFQNEIYHLWSGGPWGMQGRRFGVIAGSDRVAIQIVLNNEFQATPNEQRNLLERYLDYGERQEVRLDEFEEEVRAFLPTFLREFIKAEDSKTIVGSDKADKACVKMMQEMGLLEMEPSADDEEQLADQEGDGEAPVKAKRRRSQSSQSKESRQKPTTPNVAVERTSVFRRGLPVKTGVEKTIGKKPRCKWKESSEGMKHVIGFYDANADGGAVIMLHIDYPVVEAVVEAVIASGIDEVYRSRVLEEAKTQIEIAALRHVLWATACLNDRTWNTDQANKALEPESLTASIGYYSAHTPAVEQQCRHFKGK